MVCMAISSRNLLAIPLGATPMETQMSMDQSPCEVEHRGCSNSFFQSLNWSRHAVEPRTGIEFPAILDNIFAVDNNSSFTSEVNISTVELFNIFILYHRK